MQIKIKDSKNERCQRLTQRMLSPLCGLTPKIDFFNRDWNDSRFIIAGAELTGVHMLLQQPRPPANSYHIGATGIFLQEVLLRTFGESIERYAQLIAGIHHRHKIVMTTYNELVRRGECVISAETLGFFSSTQYALPEFPFQPFSPESVIGWIKAPSLLEKRQIWIPAQLVFVGYLVKHQDGEPWLNSAVTTGSAAHTEQPLALRTALLELIELDSVMGHWYSSATAPRILLDERTRVIARLIEKQFASQKLRPQFYWLPNADLPGMTVACWIKRPSGVLPAAAIGLGCSLSLVDAMYKALLEAVAVEKLGPTALATKRWTSNPTSRPGIDPQQIFDLDQNVTFYASWENCAIIEAKFSAETTLSASDLPADCLLEPEGQIDHIVEGFRRTGKELIMLDLTTVDIKELGFTALRVWSPDTLSMSLPSCPPVHHRRFQAYGGCSHHAPHPYP